MNNSLYCIASLIRFLAVLSIVLLLIVFVYFSLNDGARITYISSTPVDRTMIASRTSLLSGTSEKTNDNDSYTGKVCQRSKDATEMTEIAEHLAANPPEFRIAALNCSDTFQLYLSHLSKSTMNYLSHKFEISNLTSPSLQYSFMYCTGLKIYQFFSDDKGNIRKPNQFHSCKRMSFQDSGIPTLLVSHPGSGNSWVRQLLEATTGIYTGSDRDCDIDYIKVGMFGEGITSDKVIAVKFHEGPLPENWHFKKIIYIIRNPYDAIVAEYKRFNTAQRMSQDVILASNPHVSDISFKRFGNNKKWRMIVKRMAITWRLHIEQWLGSTLPYNSSILVVKYENLRINLRKELTRMMNYLEFHYTEEDLDCTTKSDTNVFHRNHDHSKDIDYYTQSETNSVYEEILKVEKVLKKYNVSYEKHILKTV